MICVRLIVISVAWRVLEDLREVSQRKKITCVYESLSRSEAVGDLQILHVRY